MTSEGSKQLASKFSPNTHYWIIEIKEFETQYGKSYLLTDSNFNKHFSNKKISDYIERNKIINDI